MASDKKKVGDWVRIGTLTLTTLAPLLSSVGSRLARRLEEEKEDQKRAEYVVVKTRPEPEVERTSTLENVSVASQEKLQALGAALVDALDDARTRVRPYGSQLRKQSEHFADTVRERGGDLVDVVRERGGDLADVVRERGGDISQVVSERGGQLTKDVAKHSKRIKHDLNKQSKRIRHDIDRQLHKARYEEQERAEHRAQQRKAFWISLGFSLGLSAAGYITYQIIRKRQEARLEALRSDLDDYNSHIELPVRTGSSADVRANGQSYASSANANARTSRPVAASAAPADAIFLGVVSNKRYYPIETPLDQLALPGGPPVDIVYFTSEEDARTQGFSAAR